MEFDTETFITEIQNRPSIWNTLSSDYENCELKKESWGEIMQVFGGAELTIDEKMEFCSLLQKKWKSLATSYSREIRRIKTTKSWCGADRTSRYAYFKQLEFLQNVTKIRVTQEEDDKKEIDEGVEILDTLTAKHTNKKKSSTPKTEEDPSILTSHKSTNSRKHKQIDDKKDEDRMFLLSLLHILKSIPAEIKLSTQIKLLSVLNKAKKTYDSNSHNLRPDSGEMNHSEYSIQEDQHNQTILPPTEFIGTIIACPADSYVSNNLENLISF